MVLLLAESCGWDDWQACGNGAAGPAKRGIIAQTLHVGVEEPGRVGA
ncbi:MAG: hypothetical protein J0I71_08550 [Rhodanobacter sp.]|jgi:hypothetical protein|nr:hypothetical protein [Rhodanobacter sp.]MBN8945925.1 hypothetical protein [Rhodanobacter sp.]